MSTLSALYNQDLGDVYEASQQVAATPATVNALARLIAAHNLTKAYDIRLSHKHFDIEEGEQVVGFRGENLFLSTPCKNGEIPTDVLREHNIPQPPAGSIAPSDYFVNDSGEAVPYEFAYISDDEPAPPALSKDFLTEWSSILRQDGLTGLLGLSVRDDTLPINSHEKSDMGARLNLLYLEEPAEEAMPGLLTTTWRVSDIDGVIEAKQCQYCYNMSYHHKHCNT